MNSKQRRVALRAWSRRVANGWIDAEAESPVEYEYGCAKQHTESEKDALVAMLRDDLMPKRWVH